MKVQDKIIRQTVKFSKKMCLLNVTGGQFTHKISNLVTFFRRVRRIE